MKVSVLIHNWNRSESIDSCRASVDEQQYRPLQVIVHDAGSTDQSVDVIERWIDKLHTVGIDAQYFRCEPQGVAASRNELAHHADGDLLFFLDNDATLAAVDTIGRAVEPFAIEDRLAVLSARVILRDGPEFDPRAWVFRRDASQWWSRPFETFTFAATAACVRAPAFHAQSGFWSVLPYAREEEELAFGLLGDDWSIRYDPTVVVHHYPSETGRLTLADRRRVELRNGVMVLWRRVPAPIAALTIVGRVVTSLRRSRQEGHALRPLLAALPDAVSAWRQASCQRVPVRWRTVWRYLSLQRAQEKDPRDYLNCD